MNFIRLTVTALLGLAAGTVPAAPHTPASDDEIVQHLPYRLDAAARAQRAQLARRPQQLALALETARLAIDRARRHGDPRELGLAQAALAPWWSLPAPPPAVRLLRATVLQSQHAFDASLKDLDVLGRGAPDIPLALQAQAGLMRASVLQVTGRLAEAGEACRQLQGPLFAPIGSPLAVAARACSAELQSLQGRPREAEAALAALARDAQGNTWLALVRAELAERRGDEAAAEARWREALAGGGDIYTRAAHADWLLDRHREAEVLRLLPPTDDEVDALLLRRAIALHRLHDPAAPAAAQALQARFDAAQQRGETTHAREQARLALDIQGNAAAALALAQANWARQKEPADALLLLRTALAAGRPDAAEPVRRLVRQGGWIDVRLAALDRSLQP